MSNKTKIRTMIRQIVREEVAMAIHEVITELKQPTQVVKQQVSQPKPKKKIVEKKLEKKQFSKNTVLNDILNETAMDDEWKTMGGETYDSSKMNQVMASQYGDIMGGQSNGQPNGEQMVASMGKNPETVPDHVKNALVKDYRKVLKASEDKSRQKRGG